MSRPSIDYVSRGLWLDEALVDATPRPELTTDIQCDVAIIGGGFTGLWTAYALTERIPELRVVILESETCGYGAAGRNAGWVSAGIAGEARVYRKRGGEDAIERAERAMIEGIDWIQQAVETERIDCGWLKGGSFRLAFSQPQLARLQEGVASRHARGLSESDVRQVTASQIAEHVRVPGVLGGSYTPHCARIDPARLARGLAVACERRGVTIYEGTTVQRIDGRVAHCAGGFSVTAGVVVRAAEGYSTRLPGQRRRYLSLNSHMIATEPLPSYLWDEIGCSRGETFADERYHFFHMQRTPDNRIACGGLGVSYRLGNDVADQNGHHARIHGLLEAELRRRFPAIGGAAVTHRWGGVVAVPRDWSMGLGYDRDTGQAWSGGYSGHGVVAASVGGRTLADLIVGDATELTKLPWVGHSSPRWEPEPARYLGAHGISALLAGADRYEEQTGKAARRVGLVRRWVPGH